MSTKAKTVLVADDEPHVTSMLSVKLSRLHVNVIVANNGEMALHLAVKNMPDLIVTDYQMPRLTGFDMALRLREQPATASIPIIMLTARGNRLTPSEMAKTNIQRLIAKPFSMCDLLAIIAEFVDLDTTDAQAAA